MYAAEEGYESTTNFIHNLRVAFWYHFSDLHIIAIISLIIVKYVKQKWRSNNGRFIIYIFNQLYGSYNYKYSMVEYQDPNFFQVGIQFVVQ